MLPLAGTTPREAVDPGGGEVRRCWWWLDPDGIGWIQCGSGGDRIWQRGEIGRASCRERVSTVV